MKKKSGFLLKCFVKNAKTHKKRKCLEEIFLRQEFIVNLNEFRHFRLFYDTIENK